MGVRELLLTEFVATGTEDTRKIIPASHHRWSVRAYTLSAANAKWIRSRQSMLEIRSLFDDVHAHTRWGTVCKTSPNRIDCLHL